MLAQGSTKVFCLLEAIYVKAVACKVQKICNELCCGYLIYKEDCLMMNENETWDMHMVHAIN